MLLVVAGRGPPGKNLPHATEENREKQEAMLAAMLGAEDAAVLQARHRCQRPQRNRCARDARTSQAHVMRLSTLIATPCPEARPPARSVSDNGGATTDARCRLSRALPHDTARPAAALGARLALGHASRMRPAWRAARSRAELPRGGDRERRGHRVAAAGPARVGRRLACGVRFGAGAGTRNQRNRCKPT